MGWSFMGTGTIATELMVEAVRSLGQSPLWVVSRSRTDAAHFAGDLGIPHSTTELDLVLQDPSVRFAYVSAGLERRPHYITAVAGSRAHILCDGPIARTSGQAGTLAALCKKTGTPLAINQPLRASAIHQTMRRLILDGDIGAVRSVVIVRGGPYHAPPDRRRPDSRRGNGIHLDVSVGDIDLARFLTGTDPIEAIALDAPDGEAPTRLSYAIRLDEGCLFQAQESFDTVDLESMVLVAGDRGALIAHGTLSGRASGTLTRRADGRNEFVPVREHDLLLATAREFAEAGDKEGSWLARGIDSVIALQTVEAVALAARKRRAVPIRGQARLPP